MQQGVQARGYFILELEKLEIRADDLKITLLLQKGRFILILSSKHVLKTSDTLPRNGKTMNKLFFSVLNVTVFIVSLLLRKFLIQLSFNSI